MKTLFCELICCFILSSYVNAAEWRYIGQGQEGKLTVTFFVDKASIHKTDNIVRVWIGAKIEDKYSFSDSQDYDTVPLFHEYDCKLKKFRKLSDDGTPLSWKMIPPSTISETIWDTVCNNKFDY